MTPEEREHVLDQLTVLAEYYERPKSEAQMLLYVQALDDLPGHLVIEAMQSLIRTSPYFPRVSEIRRAVSVWDRVLAGQPGPQDARNRLPAGSGTTIGRLDTPPQSGSEKKDGLEGA